jgi:hypothetical protein
MDVFIDAFEDANAFRAQHLAIADVTGDGRARLLLYEAGRNTLAFYEGITRQGEAKPSAKSVAGMFVLQ